MTTLAVVRAVPRRFAPIWLVLAGGLVLWLFVWLESRRIASGAEALLDPAMLRNATLRGGLTSFFFQYLLQAGLYWRKGKNGGARFLEFRLIKGVA